VPYGFTGHEDDPEAGLTNMGGRIYDQAVGQFLQADPIVAEPASQGLNRYAYVNNSPLNFVDPSGFASQSAQGACYWPGCSGFGALAGGVGAAGPGGLAGAGLGVGMGFVVASNIGVGGPAASSVAFSGSSTITGGGAGSGAGTSAGGGFDLGQALTPEAQAGSFGASVATSLQNIARMSEAGPGPVTETAMVSRSSVSSARTTPGPGVVQEGRVSSMDRASLRRAAPRQRADSAYGLSRNVPGPQKLPKRFIDVLEPVFRGFVDLNDIEVTVVDRLPEGGRAQHLGGNRILIAGHVFDEGGAAVIGSAAHEITHVVQERLMGSDSYWRMIEIEHKTMGDIEKYAPEGSPTSIEGLRQTNFLSGRGLEGIARRTQQLVFQSMFLP
jgi:RHS repeat-associated protein